MTQSPLPRVPSLSLRSQRKEFGKKVPPVRLPSTPTPASSRLSPHPTPGKRSQSGSQISPRRKKLIKTRDGTILGETTEPYVTAPEVPRSPTPHPTLAPSPIIIQKQRYPPHMKNHVCHLCRRQGHFQSYCDLFTCYHCGEIAPGHYPSNCPSEAGPSSHGRFANDPIDDDDPLDEEAWGNITGDGRNDFGSL